jgi:exopolyphosphatase/guanosine-5'-triphosphate,3'-diphosphate pyrophosphatase
MPRSLEASTVAIAEIGTNSTKLLVARIGDANRFEIVHFSKKTTRIGGDLHADDRIDEVGLVRTLRALDQFQKTARTHRCDRFFVFATYALRKASNAPRVVRRIQKSLNHPVRILSGQEEARFAYLSANHAIRLRKHNSVLVDIGGGSTELVLAQRGRIVRSRSLPLGALGLTERFVHGDPIDDLEFARLRRHTDGVIGASLTATGINKIDPRSFDLVGSGGSIATASKMIAVEVHGKRIKTAIHSVSRLSCKDVSIFLERCLTMTLAERKRIRGLEPSRADIIPAGLAIILSFMRHTRKRVLYANPGGVREGALVHLIANGFQW